MILHVFFSDVSIPANVAKVCIHTINSIFGDSIVVSVTPRSSSPPVNSSPRFGDVTMSGDRVG